MKQWYSFYNKQVANGQRLIDQLDCRLEISQRGVGQLEMPEIFGRVPWGQHIVMSRCSTLDEAIFYINQVAGYGWSRPELNAHIDTKLFQTQGAAVTNFARTLPTAQGELAKEILLELGRGFSFVGRQMELQMPGGQTFFPDLVFYHIPQHRYVIIELKTVKYIPEFAGKLNFYVTAADNLLRGEGDNPSVGLIICKSTDKTIVEWSLKDINKPLGVATYQLQEVVDRTVAEIEQRAKKLAPRK